MNVVDSSGWLEWFNDAPNASAFAGVLQDTDSLLVPSIAIFEVHRVATRLHGRDRADELILTMTKSGRVVGLDTDIAVAASEIAHANKLATADAIIYATAVVHSATLWTQDAHFKELPGVQCFAKPPAD